MDTLIIANTWGEEHKSKLTKLVRAGEKKHGEELRWLVSTSVHGIDAAKTIISAGGKPILATRFPLDSSRSNEMIGIMEIGVEVMGLSGNDISFISQVVKKSSNVVLIDDDPNDSLVRQVLSCDRDIYILPSGQVYRHGA